jgi:hypothetical protein
MLTKTNKKVSQNYSCQLCDYNTSRQCLFNKHLLTAKHINLTSSNEEVSLHYDCDHCNYTTTIHSNYKKHLLTAKHIKLSEVSEVSENVSQPIQCSICNKIYKSRPGLWAHKKKCIEKPIENTLVPTELTSTAVIIEIIKQNQEFKTLLIEQQKIQMEQQKENKELINKVIELSKEPRIVNNGTMTQNNNQKFNLQFFLNDTCKDAITIQQFINNIQISLEDLESVGRNGFVKGISDIVLKELNTLDVTKRPIHCTDLKREVIYLKEEDKWNKDDDDNTKLKNVIKTVENKSWNKIPEWQQENPEVMVSDTPAYIMRDKIMRNVYGNYNAVKLREKIVKVIAKETHLEKENHFIEEGNLRFPSDPSLL